MNIEIRRSTPEQVRKVEMRLKKDREKALRRMEIKQSIFAFFRAIIYTPLSIAFHAISFVARGIGWVASFGMLVGVYYAYKVISAMIDGAPLSDTDLIWKAVFFLIAPFIVYAFAEITENIYLYFDENR